MTASSGSATDASPIRSAAVMVLANDPDPAATNALVGDKSWLVRAAPNGGSCQMGTSLGARYGAAVRVRRKYTAATKVLRLTAIDE